MRQIKFIFLKKYFFSKKLFKNFFIFAKNFFYFSKKFSSLSAKVLFKEYLFCQLALLRQQAQKGHFMARKTTFTNPDLSMILECKIKELPYGVRKPLILLAKPIWNSNMSTMLNFLSA